MLQIKIIPLAVISFISMVFAGLLTINLTTSITLINNPKNAIINVVLLLISVLVLVTTYSLLIALDENKSALFVYTITTYIGYIIGTYALIPKISNIIISAQYILILVGLLLTLWHFRTELGDHIKIKLGKISSKSFKTFFLLFAISSTLVFYTYNKDIKTENIITDDFLSLFVDPATKAIEMRINEQINNQIQNQLSALNIDLKSHLNQILPLVNDEIVASLAKEYGQDLDTSGLNVSYNQSTDRFELKGVNTIVKPLLKKIILKYTKPYEIYLPFILSGLFYLTIVGLLSITRLFITPFTFLTQEILLGLGYIKKETKMIEVERISL